ncbi:MAG: SpoIIE family protein phosphatase [Bacteroidales bacterium]|nr:SpoIIE family protein phosphatase [Bacteroidales bacterium]
MTGRIKHILLCVFIMAVSFSIMARDIDEIKRSGKIIIAFTETGLEGINYKLALEFARYLNVEMIVTAADCTGHGVPGVFMSMLGIAYLNEIVNMLKDLNANEILNYLRDKIIQALGQTGKEGGSKDGMDMTLCIIDPEEKILQYSGANNPLYLVRNGELIETKADKMPVAIHEHMASFSNHYIQLEKGDNVYLLSDGYADQFGGPKGKKLTLLAASCEESSILYINFKLRSLTPQQATGKRVSEFGEANALAGFMYKPLKNLLVQIADHSMAEQQKILEKTIDDWQGSIEQIDDMVFIGMKI